MVVTLRKATSEDVPRVMAFIPAVVKLLNEGGNFQWDHQYPLTADFQADVDKNVLWVAVDEEADDRVIGVGALTCDQYPEYGQVGMDLNDPCVVPHRVAVDVDYRGKGIAQKILLQAEFVARDLGMSIVRVDTNVKNGPMRHIFEKLGYKHFGDVALGFKNPDMRFCCFEKRL